MVIYISLLNIITLNKKKKKNLLRIQSTCDESSSINNRIPGLVFNFLLTKISSHKFLNALKYFYHLVK